jgi:predicted DNA-binding antitoxin AbrB/MazE fold protein
MPKVKGIYENGIIRPLKKIEVEERTKVTIVYGKEKKATKKHKIPTVKAGEIKPLIGIIAVGGDAVKDTEKYYD